MFKKNNQPLQSSNETKLSFTWILVEFLGRNHDDVLKDKSDEYTKGYLACREDLRYLLTKLAD